MKINVITLGGARYRNFVERMEGKFQWTFAKGFKPEESGDFVPLFAESDIYEHENERDPKAVIACAKSHYKRWEECAESGVPMIVLEDDAEFASTEAQEAFLDFISKEPEHDLIYLDQEKSEPGTDYSIREIRGFHSGCAYMIKPEAAKRAIAHADKGFKQALDWELIHSQEGFHIATFDKPIFVQADEISGIKIPQSGRLRLVVARSWREFGKQQAAAVFSLYQLFREYDVHLHLCINGEVKHELLEKIKQKMPDWKFNIYDNAFFDRYARSRGATEEQIEKFPEWMWIYHILLYHYLWFVHTEKYVLTYDDDIFFNAEPGEVLHKVHEHIPFCMGDQFNDSDKPLLGKLVLHFGNWILDEYYSCWSSTESSNSGFMGLINKEIFSPFASPEDFRKLLDMFEYKQYRHENDNSQWDQYKILLQEQSFLGILNRAFSRRRHEVLNEKYSYSISNQNESKVAHYVAKAKFTEEFKERVDQKYRELLNFIR